VIAEIRSLHGPPHPTQPHGGGGATGPDGVKVQSQKTRTRRSTPGGRESAAAQAGLRESAALGVAGLPAEEIGPAAALQDPPNWYRHGPELSWLLLQSRRDLQPDGVLVPAAPGGHRVPSRDLDNAVSNPALRDAVGLGGVETEAGTGVGAEVGTGVEGGGR
jgi:hypothetical protein